MATKERDDYDDDDDGDGKNDSKIKNENRIESKNKKSRNEKSQNASKNDLSETEDEYDKEKVKKNENYFFTHRTSSAPSSSSSNKKKRKTKSISMFAVPLTAAEGVARILDPPNPHPNPLSEYPLLPAITRSLAHINTSDSSLSPSLPLSIEERKSLLFSLNSPSNPNPNPTSKTLNPYYPTNPTQPLESNSLTRKLEKLKINRTSNSRENEGEPSRSKNKSPEPSLLKDMNSSVNDNLNNIGEDNSNSNVMKKNLVSKESNIPSYRDKERKDKELNNLHLFDNSWGQYEDENERNPPVFDFLSSSFSPFNTNSHSRLSKKKISDKIRKKNGYHDDRQETEKETELKSLLNFDFQRNRPQKNTGPGLSSSKQKKKQNIPPELHSNHAGAFFFPTLIGPYAPVISMNFTDLNDFSSPEYNSNEHI
jgi:hypothetical protein